MQPLQLTLQAFGPFADVQCVDFTALGNAPLFLINGATGAGKSTLLDALCFALYGQTSGKERDASQMRCDHSPAELLTEVTFTFKLGDAIYKVERQPQQERPKARGEGTTTQQTEANLWLVSTEPQQLLISKSAIQVNQKIEEITGLDANQFRQVMVLPQGKFREFLLADSSEREKLFETLFQTSIYSRIQNALKDQAGTLEKTRYDLKLQESLILEPLHIEPENSLASLLEQQKITLSQAQANLTAIKTERDIAVQHKNQAEQITAEFIQLEKNQQDLTLEHQQAAAIAHARQQWQRAQQAERIASVYHALIQCDAKQKVAADEGAQLTLKIAKAQAQLGLLITAQHNAQINFKACQHLPDDISQLKTLLPKVDELKAQRQLTLVAEKNVARCSLLNQQQQAARDAIAQQQNTDQQTREKLKQEREQLPVLKQQLEQCENIGKQLRLCEQLTSTLTEATHKSTKINAERENIHRQYQQQKTQTQQLAFRWHNQQAAFLASQLQQDQPCPVCGSCNHPAPATDNQQPLVEKPALEAAQQTLENIQQQLNKLDTQKATLQADLAHYETSLIAANNALAENPLFKPEASKTLEDYRADYKIIHSNIQSLEQHQKTLNLLDEKIQQATASLAEQEQAFAHSQQQHQKAITDLALAQQGVLTLENNLAPQWRKPQVLAAHIEQLQQQFTQADNALKTAEQNLQIQHLESSKAQAASEQHQQYLTAIMAEQVAANEQWQAALRNSAFVDQEDFLKAQLSSDAQTELKTKIENHQARLNRLGTLIEQQLEKLKDQAKPDAQKIADDYLAVDAQYHAVQEQWQQAKNRLDNALKAEQQLTAIAKQLKDLDVDFALYGTLAEAANGKNAKKLSLQRFVLSVLLDDVLIEASERLLKMSKGRYRLLRNQDRAKGNRASGLELIVEDNHTGKTRNANTLSGGESFIAALALALGLSDVVQAYAGGIKLDALFIDEGFGSLDQDALDLALQTLVDLQSSGRMIGIISHVSELKEQIAVRIDVLHGRTGNKIVLHNVV
ncbi:MAG: SMC family ATPase [Marinagarivorans sp.]|nr:SMC family ATPase [Marinagarivorans sp.]